VLWNWGVYYTAAVREAMKCFDGNKFVSTDPWVAFGNYYEGYDTGLFDIAGLSSETAPNTQAAIDALKAKLIEGDWDVFTDVELVFNFSDDGTCTITTKDRLLTNKDGVHVTVDDLTITGSMDYWIKGVVKVA
jgi:hypothetical protein